VGRDRDIGGEAGQSVAWIIDRLAIDAVFGIDIDSMGFESRQSSKVSSVACDDPQLPDLPPMRRYSNRTSSDPLTIANLGDQD